MRWQFEEFFLAVDAFSSLLRSLLSNEGFPRHLQNSLWKKVQFLNWRIFHNTIRSLEEAARLATRQRNPAHALLQSMFGVHVKTGHKA